MNKSILNVMIIILIVPMLGGCGALMQKLMSLSPKSADKNMVKAAYEKEDVEALSKYCSINFRKDDGKKLHGAARADACKFKKEVATKRASAAFAGATCDNIIKVWEEHKDGAKANGKTFKATFLDVVTRMSKCGHTDYVFLELIHWGPHTKNALGRGAIEAMEKAGVDVEQAYLKWLGSKSSNPYDATTGEFALSHYLHWRLDKGGNIDCKPYVKAWEKFDGAEELAWIYKFYRETKCTDSADWVAKGLANSTPKVRHRACQTLGIVGNKSHLKNMQILADTDASFNVVRSNKVYFVRDQCRQAVGQIEMR